ACSSLLLLVLVVHDLSVDDVVLRRALLVRTGTTSRGTGGTSGVLCASCLTGVRVQRLSQRLGLRGELLHRRLDRFGVLALQGLVALVDRGLNLLLGLVRQLVLVVLDNLLGLVAQRLRLVPGLGLLATLAVLLGVRLGI